MAKFCPECGTPANGGKFCAECGTRFTLDGNTSSAAAVVASSASSSIMTNALYTPPAAAASAPTNVFLNNSSTSPAMAALQAGAAKAAAKAAKDAAALPPPAPINRRTGYGNNGYAPTAGSPQSPALARQSSFPMATPVVSSGSPLPMYKTLDGSPSTPPLPVAIPQEPVPSAATGLDAQQCYEQCVQTISASRGGNNEDGVKAFKSNCRLYGLRQMDVQVFYDSLVRELGPEATLAFVPSLARLIPDDARRKELIDFNAHKRMAMATSSTGVGLGAMPSPQHGAVSYHNRDSFSSNGSERSSSFSNPGASKGILKSRYADHPNCDICNVIFDVTKRRHQCRNCGLFICSSCSPLRLLIPPGQQFPGAKGYDAATPQRVCIQCAPQLHSIQDQLVAQYAKANEDNMHESRGRIHVPFSGSLFKECQNAADIMGNFFRDDWGAAADRSIPVAFLQKAHGLAIMTIIKAGFMVTGQIGTGVVVAKLPDGSWSAPSAIGIAGLGGGFEIGGEIVEVMIILGSEGAVKVFHKPQVNLGAGLDIAVGPYGRSALAAASASTSGLNANYSYSLSKGLYAGVSLQGTIIAARNDLNRKFYGRDLQPSEILTGHVEAPNAARPLYEAIGYAMQGVEVHKETVARRASIMGPCRLCNCPMFVAHTHQIWNKNCKTCKHVH